LAYVSQALLAKPKPHQPSCGVCGTAEFPDLVLASCGSRGCKMAAAHSFCAGENPNPNPKPHQPSCGAARRSSPEAAKPLTPILSSELIEEAEPY
jgi:hypothetical protein